MKPEGDKQVGKYRIGYKIKSSFNFLVLISVLASFSLFHFISDDNITTTFAQSVTDQNLFVESFIEGLDSPTSMAFIDDNNILVLEKEGSVRFVSDGQLQSQPVLEVPVNTQSERGLLGIAVLDEESNSSNSSNESSIGQNLDYVKSVFLYYTEPNASTEDELSQGDEDVRNRVYKYTWNDDTKSLENPTLILDLPAIPGPNHDGGKLMIGPDNLLYGVIGDLNRDGKLQNFQTGPDPDDTGIIFRVNPVDGSVPSDNPLSTESGDPKSKYYAYGIRNSFGIDYDPLTGNIWDTENGPASNDEINLVRSGFNSGWQTIMGPMSQSGNSEDDLVNFEGSNYADPLLTWADPVAVTDIEFLTSSSLGEEYQNNIFVGDDNNGNLYYFKLSPDRTSLVLETVTDTVVDNDSEQASIIFGNGFGSITDIETGPSDGYLYVLSLEDGIIYRILPAT